MELVTFYTYYIISINAVGFLLSAWNGWLYFHRPGKEISTVLIITSVLGGAVGTLVGAIIFDRHAQKDNMMLRVAIACASVIHIVIFLILKGHVSDHITLAFWTFFSEQKVLTAYLVIINFVTLGAFGADKITAQEKQIADQRRHFRKQKQNQTQYQNQQRNRNWKQKNGNQPRYQFIRKRNITLLGLSFIGGSLGGLLGIYLFNHKTRKNYFTIGIPLMILMQIVVLFYAMNAAW